MAGAGEKVQLSELRTECFSILQRGTRCTYPVAISPKWTPTTQLRYWSALSTNVHRCFPTRMRKTTLTESEYTGIGTRCTQPRSSLGRTTSTRINLFLEQKPVLVRYLNRRVLFLLEWSTGAAVFAGDKPWETEKVMLGSWARGEMYIKDIIEV